MKWSEIYSKCNNDEKKMIEEIKQPIQLVSSFKKFIQKYGIALGLAIILFLILIIVTYSFNIQIILAYLAVVLFMLIALIFNNTYKIEIKKNQLRLYTPFNKQNIQIEYLKTIYLSRNKKRIFLIPYYVYSINIVYEQNEQQIFESFPTIMLKKNEVNKFLKSFTFKSK